ncbi:MAG TPA: NAD(P)H-dependent glycerol-3-phosphate dehydrogenase [Acidimicrobiia bacterium]|nr:NAD(P)H-dependent glycerol-3-phosphate dehydrogenase [Acidimicrobiia bacterium]
MDRIAVIGAGSWGTTVAAMAAAKTGTVLWARRPDLARKINEGGVNDEYLPGHPLPETLSATSDLVEAVEGAHAVVMAVPSHGFREVFTQLAPHLSPAVPIVSLTKGIEQGSLARMTEVIGDVAPDHDPSLTGVLTGPNLVAEIVAGQPTASVIAMTDPQGAEELQRLFMAPTFRVYTNDDVIGCELAGALKNVMAIASGMSDGLGFGDNTRAALLTRALAELSRLGVALGGRPETFAGLAGMGDLVATCSSDKSRNHRVGFALASGRSLRDVVAEMNTVAEGIKTTKSVLGLAGRSGVDMPIAAHVGMVLDGIMSPREGVLSLMTRQARAESR